jgi:hypothetical protein
VKEVLIRKKMEIQVEMCDCQDYSFHVSLHMWSTSYSIFQRLHLQAKGCFEGENDYLNKKKTINLAQQPGLDPNS